METLTQQQELFVTLSDLGTFVLVSTLGTQILCCYEHACVVRDVDGLLIFDCYYVYRYGGEFIANRYGAGSGQIWLERVRCNGTETSITDCQHRDWGRHNCTHKNDVSVSCIAGIAINSLQFSETYY